MKQAMIAIGPIRQLALAAAATLVLSACASQDGIKPAASVASVADYASSALLPGGSGDWPALDWARSIGGSELQALVDEAVRDNPGLRAAAARVQAAAALADSARSARAPSIGAGASATYQRYTEHGLVPPALAGTYKTDSKVTLDFSYDFDFWGRHAAALRGALAQGRVAQAEQHSSRLILASAIARSWLQLARQQAQLDLGSRQLAAREKLEHLVRLRYAAGLDTRSDSEQARQQIAVLRAEQAQWREAMALTRNQLAALLGQGPDRGLRIAAGALPQASVLALPDALPAGLLGRRPEVVAARWRVEAAQGDIDVARAQFYPNVNLAAFAGVSSLGLSRLFDPGSQIIGIGPAIRLPVFEGGALRAQLKGRVAGYDAAVASYNQALTEALRDVADQVQSMRGAAEQAGQLLVASEAAQQAWHLAREREQKGTANMLPVLAGELAWLAQRKVEVELVARRAELQVGLIKALGGGFDARALAADDGAAVANSPSSKSGS
ncbi:efflux transporter outer membrane subunit [Lacisediminimonas profundi]|uniref:efflux transporter outer membrane subunit n=1 Tax=Lacisediminimonas profundi TaxID=2603856 RepID=UPI00124B4FD4|nr:efflux transporter outer membrane subunit [Lacisediminimonas profundi]